MVGRKRRASTPDASPTSVKRQRKVPETVPVDNEDEESLESILALIKAQEESEALARRLQDEWARSSSGGPSYVQSNADHDKELVEDDETMARRLAAEWDALDSNPAISADQTGSSTGPSSSKDKGKGLAETLTADQVLRRFEDMFTKSRKCRCGKIVPSPRGHVIYSAQVPPPTLLSLLHAPCKSCKINYCRGCFKQVDCAITCKGKDTCTVQYCCAEVRAIALFEALGGFDRQYIGERTTADLRAREHAAKQRQKTVGTVGPGGTGYSMGHSAFGEHSAPPPLRSRSTRASGASAAPTSTSSPDDLALHWDEIVTHVLTTITHFLPQPYSEEPHIYDMLPHASIEALLSLSQLPEILGSLLRNDSVSDWIARIDVYHAMLALFRRLADCELTIPVLIGERWEMQKSCGVEEWMWGDGDITWETTKGEKGSAGQLVKAAPLYAHFKKLTRQCEAFMTGASAMLEAAGVEDSEDVAETVVKGTSLCGDIIAARDDIERAMGVLGKEIPDGRAPEEALPQPGHSKGKGKGPDPAIATQRAYAQACDRLAFKYVTLSEPAQNGSGLAYPTFHYAAELAKTATATRTPKDRLHLIKELAVMATSLPPGVWVRVDEVRNDAIKIMIAGPEGTPYAGGLFEFDCFIPLEYPHRPPLMHLRTTGGGTVRFNPNLYNNGKVCLSLLGTWPGRPEEQWSSKSTLLQVLVSIQSMILIDLPYFNEPGFGAAQATHASSIAYNKNISAQTTRWAIVDWLQAKHQGSIWADVIASHFTILGDTIRKCIQGWAAKEPRIRKFTNWPSTHSPDALMGIPFQDLDMSAMDGTYALPQIQTGRGRRGGPAPGPTAPTRDLLEEFDQGVQTIKAWTTAQE